jgi:hypothetical protein
MVQPASNAKHVLAQTSLQKCKLGVAVDAGKPGSWGEEEDG